MGRNRRLGPAGWIVLWAGVSLWGACSGDVTEPGPVPRPEPPEGPDDADPGFNDFAPSWSPDGARIAFASNRTGDPEIFVMNADGSDLENLTNSAATHDSDHSWSPDGARIVYVRNGEIFVVNADGSDPANLRPATVDYTFEPRWSPDGKKIAFTGGPPWDYYSSWEDYELFVMNADGTDVEQLMSDPAWGEADASWSPDGARIAFTGVISSSPFRYEIFVMSADGSNLVNLTGGLPGPQRGPSWSPDGSRIAAIDHRAGNQTAFVMNADGSNQVRLIEVVGYSYSYDSPAWSPDGARIAFAASPPFEQSQIFLMNADGSGLINLSERAGAGECDCGDWDYSVSPRPSGRTPRGDSLPRDFDDD